MSDHYKDPSNSMVYKASTAFAMGAVRKMSLKISKMEEAHQLKVQESGARLILHSLLLNSWRQRRRENEKIIKDNAGHLRKRLDSVFRSRN